MQNFYDNYPEFIDQIDMLYYKPGIKAPTDLQRIRLNMRHDVFFNKFSIWKDKKVLDIAGYDGRLSFAALNAGAAHTTIVEIRESVVNRGTETFKKLNVPDSSYKFINEDFVKWMPAEKYDIVICAGFLSHTYDHPKVFANIRECDPEYLLIDTTINAYAGLVVTTHKNISREGNSHVSFESFVEDDGNDIVRNWTGHPSKDYVYELAKTFEFELVEDFNWINYIDPFNTLGVEDYYASRRATMLWKRKEGWRWDRKSFIDK